MDDLYVGAAIAGAGATGFVVRHVVGYLITKKDLEETADPISVLDFQLPRQEGHGHDWHIQGKTHGKIVQRCSICERERVVNG